MHDVAELAKNAGWKLSDATHPESAHFEIKDGSMILRNKQRNAGMVEINMPFNGELDQDAEWQLQFKVRHLDGANNLNYGICHGSLPGTYFTDGLTFAPTNNQWAFMGRGGGREGKTLTLFAEGHQTVAFDDINVDYLSAADRDAKTAELAALIKTVFGTVTESKTTLGNKSLRYFFTKNPEFPKGTIAILGEYTHRREYETVDHYYIEFMAVNAPGIRPF